MAKAKLPLAAASEKMRASGFGPSRRGRPRKPQSDAGPPRDEGQSQIRPACFDLKAAGIYLGGLHSSTVRGFIDVGILDRVKIVLPNGKEVRRVLVTRASLDHLVATSTDPGS